MTVGELIDLLTAQAAQLPDGLDSRVVAGVEDDDEGFGAVYTAVQVATWRVPARGDAVLVRGVGGPDQPTIEAPRT